MDKNKSGPIIIETKLPGGKIDVDILCEHCGEPIIKANKFGMFCKNDCGLEESKDASEKLEAFFENLTNLIGE